MRRVRLKLAPKWVFCDLFDADTGDHRGQDVLLNKENMLALFGAAKHRPAVACLRCLERPLRVGSNGEVVTRMESVLVVEVTPHG